MSHVERLAQSLESNPRPLRILGASGQLGYGIPTASFEAGLARQPDMIGCDMGSIDIGPYCLGSGEMGTAPASTRRDLRKMLLGARRLGVPLVIGSAGSAGAAAHLDATLDMVRDIAREEGLHFRLVSIRADIDRPMLKQALRAGRVGGFDGSAALTEADIDNAGNIVGQMGHTSFARAHAAGADVIIAGRSCDTAIFASLPIMLGFPAGLSVHAAKIIECASLCCVPGGRDPILATLDHQSFELESMAPQRAATPVSVAAHSLYEQSDPFAVHEPEGELDLHEVQYEAIDARRTRVRGAVWRKAAHPTVKIEGACFIGHRAILVAGVSDPRFMASYRSIFEDVRKVVHDLVCEDTAQDYQLIFRLYGLDGVLAPEQTITSLPREAFVLAECIAPTPERAEEVVRTTKQYLLHHGYPGRLSTGGNLAFPFTPPEVSVGPAYRFNLFHLMQVDTLDDVFPFHVEEL
jgi:hypothetical protein